MTKPKIVTLELPSEEELALISDEEHERRFEALEGVQSFEELIEILTQFGINVIEEDDELPGPNDTIH